MSIIENTRWVSFYVKFTRQGFEKACWHREAWQAIQYAAFSKPDIKRHKPGTLFISLPIVSLFKLAIMT